MYIGVSILSAILSVVLIVSNPGSFFIVLALLLVLIACGMFLYYKGLKDLENCLDNAEDSNAVKKLSLSALISIAINIIMAIIYLYVHFNFSSSIIDSASLFEKIIKYVALVPLVLNIIGFSYLKNAETFPGNSGANTLFVSSIMSLVANVLIAFPYVAIVGSGLSIAAFILYIVGWVKVKNSWEYLD